MTHVLAVSAALIIPLVGLAGSVTTVPGAEDFDYDPPLPGSYVLPVIKPAGQGRLLNSKSELVELGELTRDRITVMSFIYTRCAAMKACPYATGVLLHLHRMSEEDAELSNNLRLVSLSFDPGFDTPHRMADYSALAAQRPAGAPWHFLTARSQAELEPILEAYGQAVDRKRNPLDPAGPLNHTLRVFLIDGEGRVRNVYSSSTLDARLVLADVRTLVLERECATACEGEVALLPTTAHFAGAGGD